MLKVLTCESKWICAGLFVSFVNICTAVWYPITKRDTIGIPCFQLRSVAFVCLSQARTLISKALRRHLILVFSELNWNNIEIVCDCAILFKCQCHWSSITNSHYDIMNLNVKEWCSTIPPISTKLTISSHPISDSISPWAGI
jgi:hypothetical protein